jgi:FkbM family methyltransferase
MEYSKEFSRQDRIESSARDLLYGTAAFFPLRSCYQGLFNRQKQRRRRKMRDFYAPFVRRGDLVFDVGANIGTYSELFSELGATVVAIEPNPRCCETLRKLAKARRVYVEECAVGDVLGKAKLRICEESGISTLTNQWYENSRQSQYHRDAKWLGEHEVNISTLDQLVVRYGVPSFVKIDVEGYDDHVLRGISFLPPALSFEFNRMAPEVALRCMETETLATGYRFNYMRGVDMRLVLDSWVTAAELQERLDELAGEEEYGDVLARRTV